MKTTATTFLLAALLLIGCANDDAKSRGDEFFTSGSNEADQRAEQLIAKDQQLKGEGEAAQDEKKTDDKGVGGAQKVEGKKPLYDRLGGAKGVTAIVDDFVTRVLADPRVNWERKGITRGGFSLNRNDSVTWDPNPQNVERLKKHLGQFIALATGGPTVYEGRDMKESHSMMHITNAEFNATIGDMKATLDKLQIPTDEQKELLAILESTRPQVSEQR